MQENTHTLTRTYTEREREREMKGLLTVTGASVTMKEEGG